MKKKAYIVFLSLISVFPAVMLISFSLEAARSAGELIGPKLQKIFPFSEAAIYNYQANAAAVAVPAAEDSEDNADFLPEPPPKLEETVLLFVGDIMLGRGVEKSVEKNGGEFSFLFENAEFIKAADITFGNLEGPISDKGSDRRNLYSFRFKPETASALKAAGFDALSLANNHTGDWGREAFEDTVSRLTAQNIPPVGGGINEEEASSPKVIEINGLKIGFLGFSDVGPDWLAANEDSSGILIVDNGFKEKIKEASRSVDVLITSFHFGDEYQKNPNQRQKNLARAAIDNGAKIVVGHHPHVVQGTEEYNGGFIAYSLGNFIFDQNFSEDTMRGAALEVKLSEDGEIKSAEMKNIKINQFFQPELAQ
ncbi:MAG: CapA family protein [Candidatus Pacebacteria bacterium]|nr:CapA family protein [Candidatus Paceibacterota bacterium]NUQ57158.1 CapA family protein [Candidatus Paceibacter sp.]